jgi:hypothetical protein
MIVHQAPPMNLYVITLRVPRHQRDRLAKILLIPIHPLALIAALRDAIQLSWPKIAIQSHTNKSRQPAKILNYFSKTKSLNAATRSGPTPATAPQPGISRASGVKDARTPFRQSSRF